MEKIFPQTINEPIVMALMNYSPFASLPKISIVKDRLNKIKKGCRSCRRRRELAKLLPEIMKTVVELAKTDAYKAQLYQVLKSYYRVKDPAVCFRITSREGANILLRG